MYKITKTTRKTLELAYDGEFVAEYAGWQELAEYALAEMDFLANLFEPAILHDLALAMRAYPEQRLGQIIVNAIIKQENKYSNHPEIFYATNEKLIEGLRLLFTERLIPHDKLLNHGKSGDNLRSSSTDCSEVD